jgi:hypothetical protein
VEFADGSVVPGIVYCYRARAHKGAAASAASNEACAVPGGSEQTEPALFAVVLPSSRSVQIGSPATAFATLMNAGSTPLFNCGIAPKTTLPAVFSFQTTDGESNVPTGTPYGRVTIPARASHTFALTLVPKESIQPTDLSFDFACDGATATVRVGLNTLLVSASRRRRPISSRW